jgi:hypothetical protein
MSWSNEWEYDEEEDTWVPIRRLKIHEDVNDWVRNTVRWADNVGEAPAAITQYCIQYDGVERYRWVLEVVTHKDLNYLKYHWMAISFDVLCQRPAEPSFFEALFDAANKEVYGFFVLDVGLMSPLSQEMYSRYSGAWWCFGGEVCAIENIKVSPVVSNVVKGFLLSNDNDSGSTTP